MLRKLMNICELDAVQWLFSVASKKSHEFGTANMPEIAYFALSYFALSEAKKKVAECLKFSDFHYFAS